MSPIFDAEPSSPRLDEELAEGTERAFSYVTRAQGTLMTVRNFLFVVA